MTTTDRIKALKRLADLGIDAKQCGLHKLTTAELEELTDAIQCRCDLIGNRAFVAAMGR